MIAVAMTVARGTRAESTLTATSRNFMVMMEELNLGRNLCMFSSLVVCWL